MLRVLPFCCQSALLTAQEAFLSTEGDHLIKLDLTGKEIDRFQF